MRTSLAAVAALLVAAAVLSGCSGKPADTPAPTVAPAAARARLDPPTGLVWAPPVDLGTIQGGAEPSIAVAPDGAAYVVTPLDLWRSKDGGAVWEWLGDPTCPGAVVVQAPACPGLEERDPGMQGGGDADLYVAPDGTLHWLGLFASNAPIPYQSSTDQGAHWSKVQDLSRVASTDREWITGRADGTLFANWRNFPAADGSEKDKDPKIVMRMSTDGGATWGDQHDIANDTRQGGIAVDPSSNWLALAYDAGGKVWVARSNDNGTTWQHSLAVDDPRQGQVFPATAYDRNGTLYLVYSHDASEDAVADTAGRPFEHTKVYLQASHDKGLTWSSAVQVNPPGTTAWFPWVAAGAAGKVVVTWYQNDEGYPRQVGGQIHVMAGISLDADFPQPRFTVGRVDPDPVHTGPECRETTGVCTRSLLDFFEVAIGRDGHPILAYASDVYQVPRDTVKVGRLSAGPDLWAP